VAVAVHHVGDGAVAYVETFNGRVRDELLNIEEFTSLTVAQIVVEAWRIEYNTQVNPVPGLSAVDPCRPVLYAPNVPQRSVRLRSVALPIVPRTLVR
jgi:Integrase core domain